MEKVAIDGITEAVDKILKDYGAECYEDIAEVVDEVGKEAVKKLKATSPKKKKNGGRYAKGWKLQINKGRLTFEAVVYNNNAPQLTHLLENGHAKRNGVGRVDGIPHIEPVNEWAENEAYERLEKRLGQ